MAETTSGYIIMYISTSFSRLSFSLSISRKKLIQFLVILINGDFLENMSPYILNLCYKGHLIGLGGGENGQKWP